MVKLLWVLFAILLAMTLANVATNAYAGTTVTVTVTQSQSTSQPVASGGCNWTYPSSCYQPRTIIIRKPYRKKRN